MAMNGADVLLLVNTGSEVSPVYEAVGSQRDVSFEETTEGIDASSKDSRAGRVLPGRYGASVSLEHLYVADDDAYLALRTAMRDGTLIKIRRQDEGVEIEEADALITSLGTAAPDQDVMVVSCELTIDGEWSVVGS